MEAQDIDTGAVTDQYQKMDEHAVYLINLSTEWKLLARQACTEEAQKVCKRFQVRALEDLMQWRRLHHDHLLGTASPQREIII